MMPRVGGDAPFEADALFVPVLLTGPSLPVKSLWTPTMQSAGQGLDAGMSVDMWRPRDHAEVVRQPPALLEGMAGEDKETGQPG